MPVMTAPVKLLLVFKNAGLGRSRLEISLRERGTPAITLRKPGWHSSTYVTRFILAKASSILRSIIPRHLRQAKLVRESPDVKK